MKTTGKSIVGNSISFGPSETSESARPKGNPKSLQHAHSFDANDPAPVEMTTKPKKIDRRSVSFGDSASSSGPSNYAKSTSNIGGAKYESEDGSLDFNAGFDKII